MSVSKPSFYIDGFLRRIPYLRVFAQDYPGWISCVRATLKAELLYDNIMQIEPSDEFWHSPAGIQCEGIAYSLCSQD